MVTQKKNFSFSNTRELIRNSRYVLAFAWKTRPKTFVAMAALRNLRRKNYRRLLFHMREAYTFAVIEKPQD